jgi:hypothetical protein
VLENISSIFLESFISSFEHFKILTGY